MTDEEKKALIAEIHASWDKSELPEDDLEARWLALTWSERLGIIHDYIFEQEDDSFVNRHYAVATLWRTN